MHGQMLEIGPGVMPDFVSGIMFRTIMAWPTRKEANTRRVVSEEMMAEVLVTRTAQEERYLDALLEQWPQFDWAALRKRSRKRRPALSSLRSRLRHRMAAGRGAWAKLHEPIFGSPPNVPTGMTAPSIKQISAAIISRHVQSSDPDVIRKTTWRKSLPIIHLAAAADWVLSQPGRGEEGSSITGLRFHRDAVMLGIELEQVVLHQRDFAVTPNNITRVRWCE